MSLSNSFIISSRVFHAVINILFTNHLPYANQLLFSWVWLYNQKIHPRMSTVYVAHSREKTRRTWLCQLSISLLPFALFFPHNCITILWHMRSSVNKIECTWTAWLIEWPYCYHSQGRTFARIIQDFLIVCRTLNEDYLPIYETEEGRKVYEETLAAVNENYPQYVRELQGISDGAKVPFHKVRNDRFRKSFFSHAITFQLFLLHMDEITPNAAKQICRSSVTGCSTVIVNHPGEEVLGHTEDALPDVLNHWYLVSAHIIPDPDYDGGKWGIYEERFTSLCYAGHLPGYTMGYNHHGVVFSINTLSAARLNSGKIRK